jgi:hypothetical protein
MNAQLDIFGSQPQFNGETFVPERDGARLTSQLDNVRKLMTVHAAGLWLPLSTISHFTGAPEASVSARLRDLRREGLTIERRYVRRGLWEYRVAPDGKGANISRDQPVGESE